MIGALKRRMILTVLIGLLLASAGLVACINLLNQRDIESQVNEVLDLLIENDGERPLGRGGLREGSTMAPAATWQPQQENGAQTLGMAPAQPDGGRDPGGMDPGNGTPPDNGMQPDNGAPPDNGMQPGNGTPPDNGNPPDNGAPPDQPDGIMGQRLDKVSQVGMSNYYTIWLDADGNVTDWVSDRSDLYTDQEIDEMAARVFAHDKDSGKIGSQYFRRSKQSDAILIVVVDARQEHENARSVLRTTILVALIEDVLLSIGAVWVITRLIKPVDQAFEKQKQFVWDASHELKTPLAVISANAQVLEGEIGENEELSYIRSEVDRSDVLLHNLLSLARMDKGTNQQKMERFDLSRAILSVTLPFESVAFEEGRTLETDVPEGIVGFGNEEMIRQLTVILLSNAVKYSNDGGLIRVTLMQKGDKRLLKVFNTGEAIPEEAQDKIFDRFYRVDTSHNSEKPGNGLGLSIAKSIVEAHKGRIEVRSEAGEGTTFMVTLSGERKK